MNEDAKIGMALGQLTDDELRTIVANQFQQKLGAKDLKPFVDAIIWSADNDAMRAWLRYLLKGKMSGGVPLKKALETLATEHGGGSEVVAQLATKLTKAAS